jgi:hypothetical protein
MPKQNPLQKLFSYAYGAEDLPNIRVERNCKEKQK